MDRSKVDLSPIVTARVPLSQATDAFETARDVHTNLKVHIRIIDE